MIALGCVTGRFQPVHRQHLALFEIALAACRHLIIAVTNPDTGVHHAEASSRHRHTAAANPFSYFERLRLLEIAVRERGWDECITVVPFDLTRAQFWSQYVPLSAQQFVRAYSDWERQKAEWLEHAGYAVTLLEGDSATRLSGIDIRDCMRSGDGRWRAWVPASTVPLLDTLLEERPLTARA